MIKHFQAKCKLKAEMQTEVKFCLKLLFAFKIKKEFTILEYLHLMIKIWVIINKLAM